MATPFLCILTRFANCDLPLHLRPLTTTLNSKTSWFENFLNGSALLCRFVGWIIRSVLVWNIFLLPTASQLVIAILGRIIHWHFQSRMDECQKEGEVARMWKESVVAQQKYWFDIWTAGRSKTMKITQYRCPGPDSNRALSEYESRSLLLDQPVPCLLSF
jgi:hypothetical protein